MKKLIMLIGIAIVSLGANDLLPLKVDTYQGEKVAYYCDQDTSIIKAVMGESIYTVMWDKDIPNGKLEALECQDFNQWYNK